MRAKYDIGMIFEPKDHGLEMNFVEVVILYIN